MKNLIVLLTLLFKLISINVLYSQVKVDFSGYNSKSEIVVKEAGDNLIRAEWKTNDGGRCAFILDLKQKSSLIKSIEGDSDRKGRMTIITENVNPRIDVIIGSRDPSKKWPYIFFDKVDLRPFEKFSSSLVVNSARIVSDGLTRISITLSEISAGAFYGDLVFKLYSGSPFIHITGEMVMPEPRVAYLYDGLLSGSFTNAIYKDNKTDKIVIEDPLLPLQSKTVRHRTIMSGFKAGTLAIFPAPHAFIYPLDFSDNYGFVQAGRENGENIIGIKSQPNGDNRYRPWIDAPKYKKQHMSYFVLISTKDPANTLEQVKQYTHGDIYKEIPGYITFANHFHAAISMTDSTKNPQGPKFRDAMLSLNVKTVEVAEFHGDGNPRDTGITRLNQMKKMFEVCQKYSVPEILTLIPGEEPNAFFPGHTMSFFPKPVYITLRKGVSQPYKEFIEGFGDVYHAGNEIDIYNIYRDNGAIVWTSHPRIKGSENTPDFFADHPTFQDDNVFFGGDWKAMPLDLSDDRLGIRSLKLLDDMNQMGFRKGILGEVDPFKIDISHELYGHMNINYVNVSKIPPANDWSPVFNAIKNLDFFTSTGEVLIYSWSVSPSKEKVIAELDWTFPMAFAQVTWGEGDDIKTKRFSLTNTKGLIDKSVSFEFPVNLSDAKWVRFEAWDIALNGAFTQTIWLTYPSRSLTPIIYNFSLIDDEGYPIPGFDPIKEGETINLTMLGKKKNFYLRANTNLMATMTVTFSFDDKKDFTVINKFPYSIPVVLTPGKHELSGSPGISNIVDNRKILNFIVID